MMKYMMMFALFCLIPFGVQAEETVKPQYPDAEAPAAMEKSTPAEKRVYLYNDTGKPLEVKVPVEYKEKPGKEVEIVYKTFVLQAKPRRDRLPIDIKGDGRTITLKVGGKDLIFSRNPGQQDCHVDEAEKGCRKE